MLHPSRQENWWHHQDQTPRAYVLVRSAKLRTDITTPIPSSAQVLQEMKDPAMSPVRTPFSGGGLGKGPPQGTTVLCFYCCEIGTPLFRSILIFLAFSLSFRNFTQHLNTFVDFNRLHTDALPSNLFPCRVSFTRLCIKLSTCPAASLCPVLKESLQDLETEHPVLAAESGHSCAPACRDNNPSKRNTWHTSRSTSLRKSFLRPLTQSIKSLAWETRQRPTTWYSSLLRILSRKQSTHHWPAWWELKSYSLCRDSTYAAPFSTSCPRTTQGSQATLIQVSRL